MNTSFVVFLLGYLVLIAGVAYGMDAAGLGSQWIITAVLILIGLGIIGSLSRAQSNSDADTSDRSTTADHPRR